MDKAAIDKAFEEMISQKGIEVKLDVDRNYVYQLRRRVKDEQDPAIASDRSIKLETKIDLLRKSGWREDDAKYTRSDLVSLVNFTLKTSQKARDFGAPYIVDKWELKKS
jgi:hypothetical protein